MNDEPAPICPRCGGRDVDTHPTVYYVIWCDRCGALAYDSDTGEVVEPVSELRRRLDLDNRRYYYQETFDARAFKAPGPWACVES